MDISSNSIYSKTIQCNRSMSGEYDLIIRATINVAERRLRALDLLLGILRAQPQLLSNRLIDVKKEEGEEKKPAF